MFQGRCQEETSKPALEVRGCLPKEVMSELVLKMENRMMPGKGRSDLAIRMPVASTREESMVGPIDIFIGLKSECKVRKHRWQI